MRNGGEVKRMLEFQKCQIVAVPIRVVGWMDMDLSDILSHQNCFRGASNIMLPKVNTDVVRMNQSTVCGGDNPAITDQ